MKPLNVLIAGEESQAVCIAFRNLGHEAYSCDLQPCSGGHPEWHIQSDWTPVIQSRSWDLIIWHPDCTALSLSGNRWYGKGMPRHNERLKAIAYTIELQHMVEAFSKASVTENPTSVIWKYIGQPQYIQPYDFGHGETKKTGLYLRNLPELKPTNKADGREHRIWKMAPSPDRKKLRSKTYPGIAEAMATQWSSYLTK